QFAPHNQNLQEASGVFNRHEGLALLTTIVEGGGNCNPASDPLTNQPLLSANIINKHIFLLYLEKKALRIDAEI
ncbi:Os02g0770300, partial [Oryza sativa Japonica Group]